MASSECIVDLTDDSTNVPSSNLQVELTHREAALTDVRRRIAQLRAQESELAAQVNALHAQIQSENAHAERVRLSAQNWRDGFAWDATVVQTLRDTFGFDGFRTLQREVINSVLSKKDTFVVMPTGSGKSLTFQLPTLVMQGLCLVVSPLISLMKDQIAALQKLNISCALLTAHADKQERSAVLAKVASPLESGLKLLYVTPELLAKSKTATSKLQSAYNKKALILIVIDECHCCSAWGHEFRPDYLKLSVLKVNFPGTPVLALTATATDKVTQEVEDTLGISGCMRFRGQYNRPNLRYSVLSKSSTFDNTVADVAQYILDVHHDACGIVYCFSRKDTEAVAAGLQGHGIPAASYHAQLPMSERVQVHEQWSAGLVQVIVATIAFGMGIDKHNVRFVIHHTMSKSLENYYQESGRAGRDGQPADCVTFYRASDVTRLSSMIADSGNRDRALQLLYAAAAYCDSQDSYHTCRRQPLADYFGDTWKPEDCAKKCDVCCGAFAALQTTDVTRVAEAVLRCMASLESGQTADTREKLTLLQLVTLMKATGGKSAALHAAPGPIAGKDVSRTDCERLIIHLLLKELLVEEFVYTAYSVNSYLRLGSRGYDVVRGVQKMPQVTLVVSGAAVRAPSKRKAPALLKASPKIRKTAGSDACVIVDTEDEVHLEE